MTLKKGRDINMAFNQQEYINKYLRETYYRASVRIPKEKKEVLDEVSLKTGKSINVLFVEAFEKQYGVDLTIVESKLIDGK